MQRFISHENIAQYRKLIASVEGDSVSRRGSVSNPAAPARRGRGQGRGACDGKVFCIPLMKIAQRHEVRPLR